MNLACETSEESLARTHRTADRLGRWTCLDRWTLGVVLLDASGRVAWCNTLGKAILSGGGPLRLVQTRLVACAREDGEALQRLVERATTRPDHLAEMHGDEILLGDDTCQEWVVSASRLRPESEGASGAQLQTLLLFRQTTQGHELASRLRADFGLTPAESRLAAALADGACLADAAERFGTTRATVRSQLKSIFCKTGVSRQTELVRLVLLGAPAPHAARRDRAAATAGSFRDNGFRRLQSFATDAAP